MWSWLDFLDVYGVRYTEGPAKDVSKGHVGIPCPGCGDDAGVHFGIRLSDGQVRGCWRDRSHWLSPVQLISQIAHVTTKEARRLYAAGEVPTDLDGRSLQRQLDALDRPKVRTKVEAARTVVWPSTFHQFSDQPRRRELPYREYLADRGFVDPYKLSFLYDLRWCDDGDWQKRIMFPLYQEGRQVGWTGRAITEARLRYRTEPPGEVAQGCVWNRTEQGGELLIVVEGPFDALKLDYYGRRFGMRAWALLGLKVPTRKIVQVLLDSDRCGFRRKVLLLDQGAEGQAEDLRAELSPGGFEVRWCEGAKDPGEMTPPQVRRLVRGLIRGG